MAASAKYCFHHDCEQAGENFGALERRGFKADMRRSEEINRIGVDAPFTGRPGGAV